MISAIILAAGESKRMGRPKMLLPWGDTTVLGRVISTYQAAGLGQILVITGGAHEQVEEIVKQHAARGLYNESFATGGMLSSLQLGLRTLLQEERAEAALIGLGDQPQVQAGCVQQICTVFQQQKARLIVPSYQHRRGHPWLVAGSLWSSLLELRFPQSPRDFLNAHAGEILYVEVDSPGILADLDTPQDYQNSRPNP